MQSFGELAQLINRDLDGRARYLRGLSASSYSNGSLALCELLAPPWAEEAPKGSAASWKRANNVLLASDRSVWLAGLSPPGPGRHAPPPKASTFDLRLLTQRWREHKLSNYDYLLHLNRLAGRRWGDPGFHPILPWVLDMTAPPDAGIQDPETPCEGWRDLTKTKWRLSKGDEQLDFTFATSDHPHHISDEALSELALCIYKARQLPKETLTRVVRATFEPNEYPGSMQRLYAWTPDECIPEFYSDPAVFASSHPEMADLAVPAWASDAADFVRRHRAALESDRVSNNLHLWIDITFGYKLTGDAAVDAKNWRCGWESGVAYAADVAAVGRVAVQLYHGRLIFAGTDCRVWQQEALALPAAVRPFVQACLLPASVRPSAGMLLESDFFPLPLRIAADFLASLDRGVATTPAGSAAAMLTSLAARAASGEMAGLGVHPQALQLCLPTMLSAAERSTDDTSGSDTQGRIESPSKPSRAGWPERQHKANDRAIPTSQQSTSAGEASGDLAGTGSWNSNRSLTMLNAIAALEGMLPMLPAASLLSTLVSSRLVPGTEELLPSRLVALLLYPRHHPLLTSQLLNRIAGLLLQASKLAGNEQALACDLLPQLLPIFTCSPSQRALYASAQPASARATPRLPSTNRADVAAPEAQVGHEEDSGYWDLVYILYPELAEAVGLALLRDLVPNWALLERTLAARFGWAPSKGQTAQPASRLLASTIRDRLARTRRGSGRDSSNETRSVVSQEGTERQAERASILLDGIGWSVPAKRSPQRAERPAESASPQHPPRSSPLPERSDASQASGPSPQHRHSASRVPWHWLGPITDEDWYLQWQNRQAARPVGSLFWERPWRLKLTMVQRWRAHRERLQALAVDEASGLVVSAGRGHVGGREAEVLRCWQMADASAGPQYTGHEAAVAGLCLVAVPGPCVASWDDDGALHVWSPTTGRQLACFAEPSSNRSQPQASAPPAASRGLQGYRNPSDATSGFRVSPGVEMQGINGFGLAHGGGARQLAGMARMGRTGPSLAGFGPSAGWSQLGGLPTGRQVSAGASAAPPAPPAPALPHIATSDPPQLTNLGSLPGKPASRGYTTVTSTERSGSCQLLAGTGDARLRWLDMAAGVPLADVLCRPSSRHQADEGAVEAVCASPDGWVAAGLASGHASVLDGRCGQLVHSWRAHDLPITAMSAVGDHLLLSASQDCTLKLWDLRKAGQSQQAPALSTSSPQHHQPRRASLHLHTFQGHKDSVAGFAVHQQDVISYSGAYVGVFSLQQPYATHFAPTKLLTQKGSRDPAPIAALCILAYSKLLAIGSSDGLVKLSR
ncbi:hypothetical protein WJX72_010051 [[Myrmecia] bisecta]|uniref:BEACH domain-containing protein n=1 Tax=[Myrmecia] bisecta TaxID=41462 RepID=A0AAW1QSF7_9CHLO